MSGLTKKAVRPIRRRLICLLGCTLAGGIVPGVGLAQSPWPSKPITIIVPFSPGTGVDVLARTLGAKLSQRLNQPVVVENKPGASGNIGTGFAARSAPDGYTLLMTANTFVMNSSVYKSIPYDPVKSFVPVGMTALGTLALCVNPELPAKSLPAAIKLFKESPGKFTYASPGNGTPQHLAMELFALSTGTNIMHVPYKGSGGAITDLIGGQVHVMIMPVHSALSQAKAGKIRILGVAQNQRVEVAPDIPTFSEQGVTNANVDLWYGLLAPKGTPPVIVAKLNSEINTILAMPDVRAGLDKQGLIPKSGPPEDLDVLLKKDLVHWSDVVKRAKIVAD